MADFVEKTAKTVQQAINDALEELGINEDNAIIEVLDEGESGGLLGIGRKPARVRVSLADFDQEAGLPEADYADEVDENYIDDTDDEFVSVEGISASEEAESDEEPVYYGDDEYTDEPESQVEAAAMDYVADILKGVGIHGRISSYHEDGNLRIDVSGQDCGAAIGRHGETLDAIQYLTSLVANKFSEEHVRVIVDIGGYRRRREQTLIGIAERTASKVSHSGRLQKLDPMNPAERRIVHSALQGYPGITTFSEGVDPDRYIVVAPDKQD
ncbi:MAG: protein jag [Clostridiaceae bacterium]|nr:protein jag [Clostridiaceae bacterium]